MQLHPEFAYTLGGPFTPDQAALIVPSADPTGDANGLPTELEQTLPPERADADASSSLESGDHDANTCPYCAGI